MTVSGLARISTYPMLHLTTVCVSGCCIRSSAFEGLGLTPERVCSLRELSNMICKEVNYNLAMGSRGSRLRQS
jgi:hypothetical protein